MKCLTCDIEMKSVKIIGNSTGLEVYLAYKEKGLFESEKRSKIECVVCPKCGKIELKAKTPEIFS